MLKTGST
ncbi:hypothetical protein RLOC_00013972 [Lonchura striata]|nr:hypothetical protein RLOC_00013972 [Lonchura striata domestica]